MGSINRVFRRCLEIGLGFSGLVYLLETWITNLTEQQRKNYHVFLVLSNLIGWLGFLAVLVDPTNPFCSQVLVQTFPNLLYGRKLLQFGLKINAVKQWMFFIGVPGLFFAGVHFFY